ncbi:MAG TPA: O-antigen ligase family protein [Candidatus Saccharimonadales bacterium]|nr:O-antigen ligase family protein [Candidatus Saccharimonadales bacterium]
MLKLSSLNMSKSTALAVVLALGVMPWFQGGRDPLGWMMVLAVALIGSFLLFRDQTTVSLSRLGLIWLSFIAWTGLSLIWTVNRYQSFATLMLYSFVGIIGLLAASLRGDERAVEVFKRSYLIVAAATSLVGAGFFVAYSYERATSTFYLPNPLAGFLLPAIMIGLWQFAEQRKLFDGLLTMLTLGVFILTDSRGGTLVLMAVIFVALILSRNVAKHWRRLLIVLVGAMAIALICNLARVELGHRLDLQGGRLKDLTATESNSTSDRIYFLRSAVAIWADRPLLGGGAGTYPTLHPKYQYRVISAGSNAHNFYVQTLAELGIVGLVLLAWVIIELILGTWRGIRLDRQRLPIALGLLALALHAGLDIESNYLVLWTLAAILVGLCYEGRAKSKLNFRLNSGLILGATVILAVPTAWLFRGQLNAQGGQNLQASGDYGRAIDYFAAASLHAPYDPDWLTAQGINHFLLAVQGNNKDDNLVQAAELASQAAKLDPYDAQHDLLLARVLLQQGKTEAATAAYRSAISKNPYDQPDIYNDLATLYLTQNKLSDAKATVAIVLALYPDSVVGNRNNDPAIAKSVATSYIISAQVAIRTGQIDAAREQLRHALLLDPTSALAKFLQQQIGQ